MKQIVTIGCLLLLLAFLTASCSSLPIAVEPDATAGLSKTSDAIAAELFSKVTDINRDVYSSRGVGSIRLERDGKEITARLAWAAQRPDKLRVELLGPFGTTLGRFATNGQWSCFYDPKDQRIYRTHFSEGDLQRLIALPVRVREMIRIINGSVPVRYDRSVAAQTGESGESLLIVQDFPFGGYQTVRVNAAENSVVAAVYGSRRQLLYGVRFFGLGLDHPARIPDKWILYGEDRTAMTFELDRCEVNIDLQEDLFQLVRK